MTTKLHPLIKQPTILCSECENAFPGIFKQIEIERGKLEKVVKWLPHTYSHVDLHVYIAMFMRDKIYRSIFDKNEPWAKSNEVLYCIKRVVTDANITGISVGSNIFKKFFLEKTYGDIYNYACYAVTLSAWRMSGKHVLVVHDEILDIIWDDKVKLDKIPSDPLRHIPYWSAYIPVGKEFELKSDPVNRFYTIRGILFAMMWDDKRKKELCNIILDMSLGKNERITAAQIYIEDKIDIQSQIQNSNIILSSSENKDQITFMDLLPSLFYNAIQCMLLLSADNIDLELNPEVKKAAPMRPQLKIGQRLYVPPQETIWNVGYRLGSKIKAARSRYYKELEQNKTGRRLPPHIRKSHWHTYLVGKGRTGKRFIFLPPIPVNMPDDPEEKIACIERLPTTQRKVEVQKIV
ncbi:MAG: hypothetical protein NZM04_00720 [Methylacidiphilales bacterium]|nr:hypothetical protein [Candidatus Methylacidiphilales bacterium]